MSKDQNWWQRKPCAFEAKTLTLTLSRSTGRGDKNGKPVCGSGGVCYILRVTE
jgi:hypothetical protein